MRSYHTELQNCNEMTVFFILIEECCVIVEKNIDKKLANRISYEISYKRCLKGKFGTIIIKRLF